MKMNYKTYYRNLFKQFGYPLTQRAEAPLKTIREAEQRLGIKVPQSLRDYYLEQRFNKSCNRLLTPKDWEVDQTRLMFMEENQRVLWWGVSVRNPDNQDPPVSQGLNDDPIPWYREHAKCSVFLAMMLHYQAVNGGFRFCGSAYFDEDLKYQFVKRGWTHYGTLNSMQAFSRQNQVVCLMPSDGLPFMEKWTFLAGAKTKRDLQTIQTDVGLELEEY